MKYQQQQKKKIGLFGKKNKHYGFVEHIKNAKEVYPDGTEIDVEYYGKKLK